MTTITRRPGDRRLKAAGDFSFYPIHCPNDRLVNMMARTPSAAIAFCQQWDAEHGVDQNGHEYTIVERRVLPDRRNPAGENT